jgi:hypothetical protein
MCTLTALAALAFSSAAVVPQMRFIPARPTVPRNHEKISPKFLETAKTCHIESLVKFHQKSLKI